MIEGKTQKPRIVRDSKDTYVIVGSVDHGMSIPNDSVLELITSLKNVRALIMETPEEFHKHFQPMSTELLTKSSARDVPIHYLSGNRVNEDIGKQVLKYAPQQIAEVFVPAIYIRNSLQMGQKPSFDSMVAFTAAYNGRFRFLNTEKVIKKYMQVLEYWNSHKLNPEDLDHFSYHFEGFIGDVREYEFWKPELEDFRRKYPDKIAVSVGEYHVPFIKDVLDGKPISPPDWKTHIETKRTDPYTPQSPEFLHRIYGNLEKALKS